jgi:hypothetical protein
LQQRWAHRPEITDAEFFEDDQGRELVRYFVREFYTVRH